MKENNSERQISKKKLEISNDNKRKIVSHIKKKSKLSQNGNSKTNINRESEGRNLKLKYRNSTNQLTTNFNKNHFNLNFNSNSINEIEIKLSEDGLIVSDQNNPCFSESKMNNSNFNEVSKELTRCDNLQPLNLKINENSIKYRFNSSIKF